MSVMQEFKEFAVKGNVVDLAVGVIIRSGSGRSPADAGRCAVVARDP